MVLSMAAFDEVIRVLFIGDGVFCLSPAQDAEAILTKPYCKMIAALEDFGIEGIYAADTALQARNIKPAVAVRCIDDRRVQALLREAVSVVAF